MFAVLALGAVPAMGSARTYDVYSCTLPDGRPAPTEGWTAEVNGANARANNGCASSFGPHRALTASFYPDAAAGDTAGWVFTAPADTLISSYTLWRLARSSVDHGSNFQDYWLTQDMRFSFDTRYFAEWCSQFASCSSLGSSAGNHLATANRFQRSGLQIKVLNALLDCRVQETGRCDSTETGSRTDPGLIQIYSARLGLSDLHEPEFKQAPGGSLLQSTTPLEGEETISFGARDHGGGIERVGVVVDGQSRLQRPSDPNATRCRRPFTSLKPCPAATDNTLVFNTATLPNGPHAIQASVIDAAGNETRSDPVVVTTRNGSRPNGRGASRFVRLAAWLRSRRAKRRSSAVVPYG